MYAVFKVHSIFTQLNSLTFVKVRELPRTKFKLRLRLAFIQLLSANGDGEIRTLDPLLARQVLSQLSYTPMFCNQLFAILITCLHAIMPSMIPMHVTPLKRCGSTLIKGDPIFISFIILNSAVYPVSMLFSFHGITLSGNGLKWTRTTDLTLIRRAL